MPSSNRGKILVVDDDPDIRDALLDTLEVEGYAAAAAANGAEALEYVRANGLPPLILLDWNMAPMNGPQFLKELDKHPAASEVPVVLITADARIEQKAASGRFAGHLSKPVKLPALFAIIARFLGG